MATEQQLQFLKEMYESAKRADHRWPGAAACEAVTETGWSAHIPKGSNNVLGIKALGKYKGPYVTADGTEQNADGTFTIPASMAWRVYKTTDDCFRDQMVILTTQRNGDGALLYQKALDADTPEDYIVEESKIWSTGVLKGAIVLQIYKRYKEVFQ